MNSTGIGALVSTSTKISTNAHGAANLAPPLILARQSFLLLIKANIWGLATLISKKAFLVDAATTAKQKAPNFWWDAQARWRIAWWNLGGDWDEFVSAVNTGKSKKPLAIKLAPASVKAKLKAQGIGSYTALGSYEQGIGAEPVSDTAIITSAAAIVAALKPIIDALFNNVKEDLPFEELKDFETYGNATGNNIITKENLTKEGGETNSMPLLIGAAAVAAFFLMRKK